MTRFALLLRVQLLMRGSQVGVVGGCIGLERGIWSLQERWGAAVVAVAVAVEEQSWVEVEACMMMMTSVIAV